MPQVSKGCDLRPSVCRARGAAEKQCWGEGRPRGEEGIDMRVSEWTRVVGCSLSPGHTPQAVGKLPSRLVWMRQAASTTERTSLHDSRTHAPPRAGSGAHAGSGVRWPLRGLCPGPSGSASPH